jgi:phenylalanyl-tRNA synthetase beta chain
VKILLSWLREFVDVPGTAEEIGATMSVRGFAVESIEEVAGASAEAGASDVVLDFEITANRPDCMSVMGMAREVATAYGLQVRRPAVGASTLNLASLKSVGASDEISVTIESPDLCPRYAAATADVTVAPSPGWMQARLRAAGIRPISNIVDITNYVLLELGHPMHAFDASRVGGGQIRVRTARAGETLRTLDGQVRELTSGMLVIADADRPMAVAGVMGGADSEVMAGTRMVVFESAYFNPLSVRRTSKTLGLKTEASMRFERGADPRLPITAMERACALLDATGSGSARGTVVDCYPARIEPAQLHLRRARIERLLGTSVPDTDVRRILESLGFALHDAADGWDITVPTRRVDMAREVDLIEEVARHYGFDRIPTTFPALAAAPPPIDPRITRSRQLRQVLTGAGFSEAMTFGFVAESAAAAFAAEGDLVPIANPLSENFSVLRSSALPGLIAAVAHNRRREQRDVRLFEIGTHFSRERGERRAVACAWTGLAGGDHWSGGSRPVDFFDIKGVVERICLAFGIEARMEPVTVPWLVAGRSASVVSGPERLGAAGLLVPAVAEQHGLAPGDEVYVAEIDLDAAERAARTVDFKVEALPKYPSVTRDISVLVDDTLPAAIIRATVRETAPPTLVRVREFDRYQGKGIPDGKVSVSLRLSFRSPDRTLTDADVQAAMDAVLAALRERHGAIQR